jgi:hypothetical protein
VLQDRLILQEFPLKLRKKKEKKYSVQYREENRDKILARNRTQEVRAYKLAYSKLPLNKLKEIMFFETELDWGYIVQQEFRKRAAEVLSDNLSSFSIS